MHKLVFIALITSLLLLMFYLPISDIEDDVFADNIYISNSKLSLIDSNVSTAMITDNIATTVGWTLDNYQTGASSNEEIIWRYLKAVGFGDVQAAGILGSLQEENDNFSPNKSRDNIEGEMCEGVGYGIAQWTDASRQEALVNYCNSIGKDYTTLDGQLRFFFKELGDYGCVNKINSCTDVEDVVDIMVTIYKKPSNKASALKTRTAFAEALYVKYSNSTNDNVSGTKTVTTTDTGNLQYIPVAPGHESSFVYQGWKSRTWFSTGYNLSPNNPNVDYDPETLFVYYTDPTTKHKYMLVAIGSGFLPGHTSNDDIIGTTLKIKYKDGTVLDAMLFDEKADKDTDASHKYCVKDGSTLEFTVKNSNLFKQQQGSINKALAKINLAKPVDSIAMGPRLRVS